MMFTSSPANCRIINQIRMLFKVFRSGDTISIKEITFLLLDRPCQTAERFLSPSKLNIHLTVSISISPFPPVVLFVPLPARG